MPHGHPDYGAGAPTSTIYTIQDLAELAARLGSINTFDRRGNVIFLESFEGSLAKWETMMSAGGSIAISSVKARHGSFACKMTTDGDDNDYCQIENSLAYPVASKLGLEVCWNRSKVSNLKFLELWFYFYDGTKLWYSKVYWQESNETWYYLSDAPAFVALSPTREYLEDVLPFHNTKLIVDFVNKEYVKLITDADTWDMADLGLSYLVTDAAPMLQTIIKTYSNGGGAAVNYIDSVIITQNEP